MLKKYIFKDCKNIQNIYVPDGCEADLSELNIPNFTKIGPLSETMVGGVRVWSLRDCTHVVIPDGAEKIGSYWFYGSSIVSAEIPASVKYIDACAFCKCKSMKRVVFAKGSRLEKIGEKCFYESGVTEICIPSSVTTIESRVFRICKDLKRVTVE